MHFLAGHSTCPRYTRDTTQTSLGCLEARVPRYQSGNCGEWGIASDIKLSIPCPRPRPIKSCMYIITPTGLLPNDLGIICVWKYSTVGDLGDLGGPGGVPEAMI